jgi:hypothetical protein
MPKVYLGSNIRIGAEGVYNIRLKLSDLIFDYFWVHTTHWQDIYVMIHKPLAHLLDMDIAQISQD